MKKENIKSLYYITHKENVESILKNGIYSHNKIEKEGITIKKIYDENVINIRKNKLLPNSEKLSDYANLYFQPRNPMLYRLLCTAERGINDIVILEISKDILNIEQSYLANANAATEAAEFFEPSKGYSKIDKIILDDQAWWNDLVGGKSKIMAEFLVKDHIPNDYILSIYTANEEVQQEMKNIKNKIFDGRVSIVLDKIKFFLPNQTYPITEKIKLIEGDMFFSTAQTITISVNTVGVMGKGLASRTRYQFPDIYVEYQDLCRSKKLAMGKPYLVKREKSMDNLLADNPESLEKKNFFKWFLLFPTKNHWRNDSDLEGIEKGLQWLVDSYEKEGIKSIALPALGCGLGRLAWGKIGPLMCKYLQRINIKSVVYLPMERNIPEQQKQKEFLLQQ
jgi:O-acetyl-ADP-ribose deacetylase (regulator of RNase III)